MSGTMRVSGSLMVLLLSTLSVQAQSQALTPEQLTHQIGVLDQRSQNTDRILSEIQQNVTKMGRGVDSRAVLELMQTLEELAAEVSQMHGQLEQQAHDISGIKKQQRVLYVDTNRRLRLLENRSVSTSSAPESSSADNEEQQLAYQAAFDTLKEGQYEKAKIELKEFLSRYPDSSYAGNAQYWLGEAYYVSRDFDQSIIRFKAVIADYPDSSKVADSMLKLGYTYY